MSVVVVCKERYAGEVGDVQHNGQIAVFMRRSGSDSILCQRTETKNQTYYELLLVPPMGRSILQHLKPERPAWCRLLLAGVAVQHNEGSKRKNPQKQPTDSSRESIALLLRGLASEMAWEP